MAVRIRFGPWQPEELSCFGCDVAEIDEAAAFADDVEEITVLAGSGIGLMCS